MKKAIIIDNDKDNINNIIFLLNKLSDIEVINCLGDPYDALKLIIEENIDIVFIEPNLKNFDGFEFIRNLPKRINVIITSGNKEFAMEAFELDVKDYLIKPVSQPRFVKTLTRVSENLNKSENSISERSSTYVKVDKKMVKIYHDQILFIEAIGDYIKIVCKGDEKFISNNTLKKFTEELPGGDFLRVHRSYTISRKRVTAMEGNYIEIGTNKIPVGRQYINIVRESIFN